MNIVGVIANPIAGTDVRRLSSPAGHMSHAARVDVLHKVSSAALENGAARVLIANDTGGLGAAVAARIGESAELIGDFVTGTRKDTTRAAALMRKRGCGALVVLGGDGTCRDVAMGWPDAPLIALAAGTNNVYPLSLDPVAVGTAAGLVASGSVPLDAVVAPSRRLIVHISGSDIAGSDVNGSDDERIALVDIAVIRGQVVGARAVLNAADVIAVVAAVSTPLASGMSSIPGRIAPLAPDDPDAIVVHLCPPSQASREVRVPLVPGSFATVGVASVQRLRRGAPVDFDGPMVLAFDGERDVLVRPGEVARVWVDDQGPLKINVEKVLLLGAHRGAFDRKDTASGY